MNLANRPGTRDSLLFRQQFPFLPVPNAAFVLIFSWLTGEWTFALALDMLRRAETLQVTRDHNASRTALL